MICISRFWESVKQVPRYSQHKILVNILGTWLALIMLSKQQQFGAKIDVYPSCSILVPLLSDFRRTFFLPSSADLHAVAFLTFSNITTE